MRRGVQNRSPLIDSETRSVGNTIRKRTYTGTESTFHDAADLAFVLGVKVGPDGCIYNASTSLDPAIPGAFVWKTCGGRSDHTQRSMRAGGPNDLVFDDAGNLFVTDAFLGRVYKITPSKTVSVAVASSAQWNGRLRTCCFTRWVSMASRVWTKASNNLYLGNLDYGRLLRVPVECDGSGNPVVVATRYAVARN